MKKQNKFAFTLIELLVVITIIGILATTWVSIFTKQLQWSRDSTRINDLKLLESASVQYFSDNDVYPEATTFTWLITEYVSKKVVDPRAWNTVCWNYSGSTDGHNHVCHWHYIRFNDAYGLPNAAFKMGIYFEKQENYNQLAKGNWSKTDWWNNNSMYELYAGAWSQTGVIADSDTIIY